MTDTAQSAAELLATPAPPTTVQPQTPADAPPSAQPEPGTTSIPAPGWADGLSDELKGFAANKGWADPSDAVKSYQHLEKLLGADKAGRAVLLPKDEQDAEAAEVIYKALGKPEAAADYGLTDVYADAPADTELLNSMAEIMHQNGLNKAQAKSLAEGYKTLEAAKIERLTSENAQGIEDLKKEYGAAFKDKVSAAQMGAQWIAKEAGIPIESIKEIEFHLGSKGVIKAFAAIGGLFGEDKFVNSSSNQNSFSMTPAQAAAKLDELKADSIFVDRYNSGDQSAKATMEKLHKTIAGEQ